MARDLYEQVTTRLLSTLDGAGEWKPCWHTAGLTMPENATTRRRYNGVNVLILWLTSQQLGYRTNRWATFQQLKEQGTFPRKDEKATLVVFYGKREKINPASGEPEHYSVMRSFNVFNLDQCDGPLTSTVMPPIAHINEDARSPLIEAGVRLSGIPVEHAGNQPCYIPSMDRIRMPVWEQFFSASGYYSTLFHEMAHATGHKSRLNRELATRFKRDSYAMEELVAELAACFVAARTGVEPIPRDDHAAYLRNWRDVLKQDNRAIITAAAAASKAADWILEAMEMDDGQRTQAA